MCGKLKSSKTKPGFTFSYHTSKGMKNGVWGFNKGEQYNARYERLNGIWREYEKGILNVTSFWEGDMEFKRLKNQVFSLGIIYNNHDEFAVLTCPANEIVKPHHHRMPLVIADDALNEWLQSGTIKQLDDIHEYITAA